MIKFAAESTDTKRPVIGIGLTRQNCEQILNGDTIQFSTTHLPGIPLMDVFIMAGEDEIEMTRAMISTGFLHPQDVQEDVTLADPTVRPADKKDTSGVN